jgi:pimeloyl-ACP methyl ester carboxylesterase
VQAYVDIHRARFGEGLELKLESQPGLRTAIVPSLLLQPLVENAIHHGFASVPSFVAEGLKVFALDPATRALMTRPESTPLLRTIHCPTLIVVGEEDVLTPPALSEEMHRAIAGSDLVVVPGAGHLSNLEQPDAFNSALAEFLTHRL